MRNLFAVVFCMTLSIPLFAQVNLGKTVQPFSLIGRPQFGVQIVHDSDIGLFVTSSFIGKDLAPVDFSSLSFSLYDTKTKQFLTPWKDYHRSSTPAILPGTYALQIAVKEPNVVSYLVSNMKYLVLVFSVNQSLEGSVPTHNLQIKDLCKSNPEKFMDLTTGESGCK